jgi:ABC-type glycerol-3-phosphate transport system substrate-binding protein
MLSYNWMLPALNAEGGMSGDLAGNFTLHEVPGGKSVLGLWSWGITANSENKDDAWTFISWITSPEVAKERAIMGGAPVRTSVLNDPDVWEKGYGEAYYSALSSILEDAAPLSSGNNAEELIEIVGTELSAAVTGQKSVQDALDAAASGVERANK